MRTPLTVIVLAAVLLAGCGSDEPTAADVRAACAEHGGVRATTTTGTGWVQAVTCLDGHYQELR